MKEKIGIGVQRSLESILLIMLVSMICLFILAIGQESCTNLNELQIMSETAKGYKLYLDGNFIGSDGMNNDLLDGSFTIYNIPCWNNHTILVDDGAFTHTLDFKFGGGMPYAIALEDPLFITGHSAG